MTRPGNKRFILPLVILLGCIFIGLGIYYYVNHLLATPLPINDIQVDTKAALKLNLLEQTSKKNGVTEWKLKAASATMLKDENKAVLEDVAAQFFTKDGTVVYLNGRRGILDTKQHDMVFSDNVVIRYQGYTMRSETLHYDKKPHILYTNSRIRIEDGTSTLEADAMEIRLNERRIILKGHVKGLFSESLALP
ncbi:MAG: LPS export ABC transporter periplasmic protein LptC [Desulfobacterales bacterium]|nr:MAG: LPS export ABC transporter periplasmic protein LptC [Desulfobacterales bacterium]